MFPAVWPTLSSIAPPTLFAIVSRFRPRVSKFVSHLVSQLCVHLFCNTPALCLPPCPQLASQLVCCCVARFVFHCVPPVSPTLFSRVSLPLSSSVPLPLCRPACFPLCLLLCLPSCFHFVSDCIFCLVSGLSPSLVLTVWHCACQLCLLPLCLPPCLPACLPLCRPLCLPVCLPLCLTHSMSPALHLPVALCLPPCPPQRFPLCFAPCSDLFSNLRAQGMVPRLRFPAPCMGHGLRNLGTSSLR